MKKKDSKNAIKICLRPAQVNWLENAAKARGMTHKALLKTLIAEKITDEKNLELLRRFGNSQ